MASNDKKYSKRKEETEMTSTQNEAGKFGTVRKYLCGNRSRPKKLIDMEWVYRQLDSGKTRQQVADELEVSVSTLNKRHHKYQKQLKVLNNQKESSNNDLEHDVSVDVLPPIPDKYRI